VAAVLQMLLWRSRLSKRSVEQNESKQETKETNYTTKHYKNWKQRIVMHTSPDVSERAALLRIETSVIVMRQLLHIVSPDEAVVRPIPFCDRT
jgi:hypothetical protein